jgi:translin
MVDIEGLRDEITIALDEEEKRRDTAFSGSRNLIRSCRKSISLLVQEKELDLTPLSKERDELLSNLGSKSSRYGFVEDALTEYSEAAILHSVLFNDRLPDINSLGVGERAYILGACDTVGELRRIALNKLLRSEMDDATIIYERMKEIGHLIEGLVYPSGMIPLKKKQDVVRSLLDRTGGELAIALNSRYGINKNGGGGNG